MASELERKRAQIAKLEQEVGGLDGGLGLGIHESMDLTPYKRKLAALRSQKNVMLAQEREKLAHEYEQRLAMDRAILHERLQRELQFRMRNELTSSIKHNAYGGLLNPPRLTGDTGPKTEAFLKAKNDFKCVSDESIPGYVVTRVLGAVSGSAYIAGTPEPEFESVDTSRSDRAGAVNLLVESAIERGANAVIGLRFDTSAPIGTAHIEILAYGTAVNIKKDNGKGQNWDGGHKHVSFKDESLHELLKRVLNGEEGGGGKKKGKQPEPQNEDEVSFSHIQAVMALLAGKGSASSGGGSNNNNNNSGWGGSGGSGGGVWGDSGSGSGSGWGGSGSGGGGGWADAGNSNNNDGAWGTGGGGGTGSNSWDNGGNGDSSWGGYGNDSGGRGSSWDASGGDGNDWANYGGGGGNDQDWGGGNGYGSDNRDDGNRDWRSGGRHRSPYSPAVDPGELAYVLSSLVQRSRRHQDRHRSRRETSRRSADSPIFAWEAF